MPTPYCGNDRLAAPAFPSDCAPRKLAADRCLRGRRRGDVSALSRDRICARVYLPALFLAGGTAFRLAIVLYNHSVFGWVALATALLNLIRPSIVLISVALAAAGFGLVLHNADLSGLAVALLILSLACRAPAAE